MDLRRLRRQLQREATVGFGLLPVRDRAVGVHVQERKAVGETGVGECIVRVELDRARVHLAPELPTLHVLGGALLDRALFLRRETQLERPGDAFGDFLLDAEHVLELPVITFRPDVIAIADVDQLGGDSQLSAGLADTALEHRRDVQPLADFVDVGARTLELERLGARRHLDALDPRQRVDISSAMPSQKGSWSLSGLMSANGSTAIDGRGPV